MPLVTKALVAKLAFAAAVGSGSFYAADSAVEEGARLNKTSDTVLIGNASDYLVSRGYVLQPQYGSSQVRRGLLGPEVMIRAQVPANEAGHLIADSLPYRVVLSFDDSLNPEVDRVLPPSSPALGNQSLKSFSAGAGY